MQNPLEKQEKGKKYILSYWSKR